MNQFFARVVELREENYVKYDGKITMDSPSREFLEMTNNLPIYYLSGDVSKIRIKSREQWPAALPPIYRSVSNHAISQR